MWNLLISCLLMKQEVFPKELGKIHSVKLLANVTGGISQKSFFLLNQQQECLEKMYLVVEGLLALLENYLTLENIL